LLRQKMRPLSRQLMQTLWVKRLVAIFYVINY